MVLNQDGTKRRFVMRFWSWLYSVPGWQEDSFTGGRWAKYSLWHKVGVQCLPFTGGVLAEGNEKWGQYIRCLKGVEKILAIRITGLDGLLLRAIDALQNENKQLRAIGN